jgi:hypothetical protein
MAPDAIVDLHKKRDIGEIINATFGLLRLIYKNMVKDILLITGPFFILGGVFSALNQFNSTFSGVQRGLSLSDKMSQIFSPQYFLSLLCILLGWSIAYCIIGNHVLQYSISKGPNYDKDAARNTLGKDFWRVLGANFVVGLVAVLGCFLFLIPGIYIAVANSLTAIILILNKEIGIGQAMGESRRLIKDNWWKSLGLGFVMAFIVGAISMIFTIPVLIYTAIISFHSVRGGDVEQYRLIYTIITAISQIGSALISPVTVVGSAIYYYSLKEEKDQGSLMAKIDSIGNQQPEKKENEGSY